MCPQRQLGWQHYMPLLCFVVLQFAPSYSDYVLYSDGGPADNVKRKKFRGQKGVGGACFSSLVTCLAWSQ
jgi:hypothetical protein